MLVMHRLTHIHSDCSFKKNTFNHDDEENPEP